MANTNSNFGGNLTTIIVSFIGMLGALGAAWITTYGSSHAPAPVAAANQAVAPQAAFPGEQIVPSAAPVVASAAANTDNPALSVPAPSSVAPLSVAPQSLPNSQSLAYHQAWPNNQRGTALVLESVEIAKDRVRLHLRFDVPTERNVTFYTANTDAGFRAVIGEKKRASATVLGAGGSLFGHPEAVTLPAGSRTTGWVDYAIDERKMSSLRIELSSTTDGYLGSGRQTIVYQPLQFKFDD